jgi:predicted nucleotidyltransferase
MTTEDEIGTIRAALARHGNIGLAIVFGSAAQGFARTESDLDIAVGARRPLDWRERSQLIGELAKAGGRAVDLIDLATVGEPPLGQILSKGRRILAATPTTASCWPGTCSTRRTSCPIEIESWRKGGDVELAIDRPAEIRRERNAAAGLSAPASARSRPGPSPAR